MYVLVPAVENLAINIEGTSGTLSFSSINGLQFYDLVVRNLNSTEIFLEKRVSAAEANDDGVTITENIPGLNLSTHYEFGISVLVLFVTKQPQSASASIIASTICKILTNNRLTIQ